MKRTTPLVLLATLLLALSAVAVAALSTPARTAANPTLSAQGPENFTLWGDATKGWGSTSTSIQTPGPTLTVTQGVEMNLTLYSNDGLTHTFCIDFDKDSSCGTSADWVSASFSSNTTPLSVSYTPATAGTFHYYCSIHYGAMTGTIVIQSSGSAPATDYTPYIVVIVVIVVVAVAVAAVTRRKPKAPQQPPTNP